MAFLSFLLAATSFSLAPKAITVVPLSIVCRHSSCLRAQQIGRGDALKQIIRGASSAALIAGGGLALPTVSLSSSGDDRTVKVVQTASGLRYIDLQPGNLEATAPQYGQLVSIAYKAFVTLPGGAPQQFDSADSYLLKHGNGRQIAGLDEGIHTMKVGGKRRLLIPPKLGYVQSGLGPIPVYPWDRDNLNRLLDKMVAVKGGTVVMEVTLLNVMDDEADQGYYSDSSLTPEQFETLKLNLQRKAMQQSEGA